MGLLHQLGSGQGYLKAGFLGFNKSGKSFTAAVIAVGLWKHLGKKGRIVLFDTEGGSEYLVPMIEKETGSKPLGVRSRSFADLMAVTSELQPDDIFLVDSITHPWRELCDAHLAKVNEGRQKKRLPPRSKLEFQDWGPIKLTWAQWTDWYLNSKVHIIICGRAGFEYEMEDNAETGKKELQKVGVKMKTESEFGFEPSLLVEMERVQVFEGEKHVIKRRATVLGDRFQVLDGKSFDNPTFKTFLPHIQLLTPGAHAPIDTGLKSDTGVDESGDEHWQRERREREILSEEVKGLFQQYIPGQTAADKKTRTEMMEKYFGTRSWTKVENLQSGELRDGLRGLRRHFEGNPDDKFDMLARFQEVKKQLRAATGSDDAYYAILGSHGYEKSNQIADPDQRQQILSDMRARAATQSSPAASSAKPESGGPGAPGGTPGLTVGDFSAAELAGVRLVAERLKYSTVEEYLALFAKDQREEILAAAERWAEAQ